MTSADDGDPRVHLAAGLSEAQQAEVRRVFAALNATRAQRHQQTAASGSAQPPMSRTTTRRCGNCASASTTCSMSSPVARALADQMAMSLLARRPDDERRAS